jgi:hypothetical protein|tara:strand:+ start:2518 stop:2934 length:417 start_codon:yes stop_codon:yes gene_type:complete
MIHIYSKVEPNTLLHIINNGDPAENRVDIIPENNFLQCSCLKHDKGKTFVPHYHIKKERHYKEQIAQESWIVIRGRVKCILYDLDNTIIAEHILEEGHASFTLAGGHNYEFLEDNSLVYEYKTGPYEGQELDKRFIND